MFIVRAILVDNLTSISVTLSDSTDNGDSWIVSSSRRFNTIDAALEYANNCADIVICEF